MQSSDEYWPACFLSNVDDVVVSESVRYNLVCHWGIHTDTLYAQLSTVSNSIAAYQKVCFAPSIIVSPTFQDILIKITYSAHSGSMPSCFACNASFDTDHGLRIHSARCKMKDRLDFTQRRKRLRNASTDQEPVAGPSQQAEGASGWDEDAQPQAGPSNHDDAVEVDPQVVLSAPTSQRGTRRAKIPARYEEFSILTMSAVIK